MQKLIQIALGALVALSSVSASAEMYYGRDSSYRSDRYRSDRYNSRYDQRIQAPGPSREQLFDARRQANKAYQQCLIQSTIASVATNAMEGLTNRLLSGRRSYGSYSRSSQNSSACQRVRDQVYRDLLSVEPEAYCENTLTTRVRRGGDYNEEPVSNRACVSRRVDDWDREFSPTSASVVRPYKPATVTEKPKE